MMISRVIGVHHHHLTNETHSILVQTSSSSSYYLLPLASSSASVLVLDVQLATHIYTSTSNSMMASASTVGASDVVGASDEPTHASKTAKLPKSKKGDLILPKKQQQHPQNQTTQFLQRSLPRHPRQLQQQQQQL